MLEPVIGGRNSFILRTNRHTLRSWGAALVILLCCSIGYGCYRYAPNSWRYYWQDRVLEAPSILLVGSSTIDRYPPALIQCESAKIRGFSNGTFHDVFEYLQSYPDAIQPQVILIYAGENDIAHQLPEQQIILDFEKLVTLLDSKFPRSKVNILAIKPSPRRHSFWSTFSRFNHRMEEKLADYDHITLIDPKWDQLAQEPIFNGDGVHLSGWGYQKLTQILNLPCEQKYP